MKNRLILFTRYPTPGLTKTRLIPVLGEQGAADLQRAMTGYILDTVRPLADEGISIEVRHEGGDLVSMSRWFGADLLFLPQEEGSLGDRMKRAFRESLDSEAGRTVIVGTDCPDLTAGDVREAFNLLDSNQVVLGPSLDGGYYLIGIGSGASDRLYEAVFANIPWGTGAVLADTVSALDSAGIGMGLLDEKADVDEPKDLVHWERILRTQGKGRSAQKKHVFTRRKTRTFVPSTASISVIIPTLNEESHIGEAVERLKGSEVETIVADGGSTDATVKICRDHGVRVLACSPGRAAQMNAGAEAASSQILLFLHGDTRLPARFEEMVRGVIAAGGVAGAFSFGTDLNVPAMRLITWAANLRTRMFGIVFGDQGIFVRADLFDRVGGFQDLPIMEDMELVRKLKRQGRFVVLPGRALTSSRKWEVNGIWKTTLMNQAVTWLYMIGGNPESLAGWYRRKLRV